MIYLAIGKKGSGKTWWLAHNLRQHLFKHASQGSYPAVLIHDERSIRGGSIDPKSIGAIASGHYRNVQAFERDVENGRYKHRIALFYQCEASNVCDLAWRWALQNNRPSVVVVDELDRLPVRLLHNDSAYRLIHHGRPIPVDLLGSTRRPQSIDNAFMSEADKIALFQLHEAAACETIKKTGWPGCDYLAETAPRLKPPQFYAVEP